jgi:hypothetical protein
MLTTWPPSVNGEPVVARKHCYAAASHCRTIKMRPTITCSDQLFAAEAYPAHATRAPGKELAHAEHRKDNLYTKRHRDQCRSSARGIGARVAHALDRYSHSVTTPDRAIARYPLVSLGQGSARLKHGTVPVMATKAERRAARERVSAYHESQLAGLLGHVGAEIDRYRAGEIDAYAADETIHHYHRAAAELWKFCFARGGGAHVEFIAGLLDRMTADAETIDWWERAAPRRHQ